MDLFNFMDLQIEDLKRGGQLSTARAYKSTSNSFRIYIKRNYFNFDELSTPVLKKYEEYLLGNGLRLNTVSCYMRILRAVYYKAIRDNVIPYHKYQLFSGVFTGNDKTFKRAVKPVVISRLRNMALTVPGLIFARDIFLISFYLRGIPFVDLAYLRKSDIKGNELHYYRKKTKQQIVVKLEPCALEIINKYRTKTRGTNFLFPIIDDPSQAYQSYTSALRIYNKRLHKLSLLLKLDKPLTSYVARHSWATIAKSSGIPISVISEGMGHDSEKTTAIYLASFDKSVLHNANRKIISKIIE